ncbi:MAG: radical SAM protein [Candidatus Omnitrophica bacterium]|nr:radical SAM protein [Candidatus Omnitrophota bacterium]
MEKKIKNNKIVALVRIESDVVIHPLGLIYLGSTLKKSGYDVRLFNIFKEDIGTAADEITAMQPLFVGISTLTGAQTKYSYEISKAIKARDKDVTIVWGGVHPTLLPEDCLKEDCVDIVAMGEGEEMVAELAGCLAQGKELKGVRGIGYKENGKFVIDSRRPFIGELDKYEPDWSLENDFEKCVTVLPDGRRQVDFVASRGCPYNCSFCYNLKFNDRRWRKHSPEYVIDKIGYLRRHHNIRAIQFHDDNFFVDMDRAFNILEKLKEMDVVATSCMIRLEVLTEPILRRLEALGVRRIFVGVESGSSRVLELINKGLTRELILKQFKLLSKFPNISVTAAMIIGFPTETMDEIWQTVDLGVTLSEIFSDIVVTFQTFIPYPGSYLYQLAIENGFNLPANMADYDTFDTFTGKMHLSWLPWADKDTKTLFYRIDKYGKLLTHSKGSNMIRTFGKEIFYRISKARLKTKFFAFPWEIEVLHRFNRYYNPKYSAKGAA